MTHRANKGPADPAGRCLNWQISSKRRTAAVYPIMLAGDYPDALYRVATPGVAYGRSDAATSKAPGEIVKYRSRSTWR